MKDTACIPVSTLHMAGLADGFHHYLLYLLDHIPPSFQFLLDVFASSSVALRYLQNPLQNGHLIILVTLLCLLCGPPP